MSIVDILPTLLDFLKIENPTLMDGKSLMPLFYGQEKRIQEPVFSELYYDLISAIVPPWKLIYNTQSKEFELYNLANDPFESQNVFREETEKASELKEVLLDWYKSKVKKIAPEAIKDQKTLEQLKSLGYIK